MKNIIMTYFSELKIIKTLKPMNFKKLPEFCLLKTTSSLDIKKSQRHISTFLEILELKKFNTSINAQIQVERHS